MSNEFDTIRAMWQLDENKTLASDSNYKVVELKNGLIRFEFVNVRSGDVMMTKEDFKKMQLFFNNKANKLKIL
jgi:hypothetical protein